MELIINGESYPVLDDLTVRVTRPMSNYRTIREEVIEDRIEIASEMLKSEVIPVPYLDLRCYFGKVTVVIATKYVDTIKDLYEYQSDPFMCKKWTKPIQVAAYNWELNFDNTYLLECIDDMDGTCRLTFKYDYYFISKRY